MPMQPQTAKSILKKVKSDYSAIAHEFSQTRNRPPPEFAFFEPYLNKGYKILDLGCGNGRLYKSLKSKKIEYTGIDNNKALLSLAKKLNPRARFCLGDALKLPFPDRKFDAVFCIAVLHHIPTKKFQLKALKEAKRVLKKNGCFFLTVWNLFQPKYKKYIDKKTGNAFIPWGQDKKIKRFYHAFEMPELSNLIKLAGLSIKKKLKNKYNLCFICYEKS